MGFKKSSVVRVTCYEHEGMRGKIIELCFIEDKPILVEFDDFGEYFHWSELEIVTSAEIEADYTTVEKLADEEYLQDELSEQNELSELEEYLQEEPEELSELEVEEYLQEPEESDIELEPTLLDKAIDTLIQGDWEITRITF